MMSSDRSEPQTPRLGQPGCPSGFVGRALGWVMARDNDPMNALAVEVLAPAPGDRVLEVGFGPGRGLERLAAAVPEGRVDGVDHSALMVADARRRNRRAVEAGRVCPRQASVHTLPYEDACFDGAMAVNNHQFWPAPVAALRELARVLRPGAPLVVAIRARSPEGRLRYDGIAYDEAAQAALRAQLVDAGFEWQTEVRRALPKVFAAALVARRPRTAAEAESGR
ncbi:MAG: class I SAM-dependent methyltransferase [Proteobacteria bacterium]|nr:class I SAM-dependent methyltransferase [Pseudomonadota bacterium]